MIRSLVPNFVTEDSVWKTGCCRYRFCGYVQIMNVVF